MKEKRQMEVGTTLWLMGISLAVISINDTNSMPYNIGLLLSLVGAFLILPNVFK